MLKISGLNVTAESDGHDLEILKDIDLTIETGELVVITGPNGGGKTTLAKAVMGLAGITSGTIEYDGTLLNGLDVTQRARLGISYGFQAPPRFKGMQIIDLLSIAAGRELSREECCTYLARVGLCTNDYVGREVDSALSGGELKRIEIATLLARNSSLMMFDEPEAGIDLWSFSKLTETFRSIHKNSAATILIISHQERILNLADEDHPGLGRQASRAAENPPT